MLEWKKHGYPFNVKNGVNLGRTYKFFTNIAVYMGCDIKLDDMNNWGRILKFARVIDNIYDKNTNDEIDPIEIWNTEFANDEDLVKTQEKFNFLMDKRRIVDTPSGLIVSRLEEARLFSELPKFSDNENISPVTDSNRARFNKLIFQFIYGGCLYDDVLDLSDDFSNGIHRVTPNFKNRLVLATKAVAECTKVLMHVPKRWIPDLLYVARADQSPDYSVLKSTSFNSQ